MKPTRLHIFTVILAVTGTVLVLYLSWVLAKPLAFVFGLVYGALLMKVTEPWRIKRNDDRLVEQVHELVIEDLKRLHDQAPMN